MNEDIVNIIFCISGIVFFVTFIIFGIYLIVSIKKFYYSVLSIEIQLSEISDRILPVADNLKYITEDIKSITERSRYQFGKVEDLSEELIKKGTVLVRTIDEIQHKGNKIITNSVNFISSIRKGFNTFASKLTNRSVIS